MSWQMHTELANQRIDELRAAADRARTARVARPAKSRARGFRFRMRRLLLPIGWAPSASGSPDRSPAH
jgi:hypothetical protein